MVVGDNVAEHLLTPHDPSQLSWDDVYPGWQSDDLKYYWKDYDNPVVERDLSYVDKARVEVIELAREGNEHAIYCAKARRQKQPRYRGARSVGYPGRAWRQSLAAARRQRRQMPHLR